MPEAFPSTVAEREAELLALQSAFDEYIASSRELEEELDGELAKMRKSFVGIVVMKHSDWTVYLNDVKSEEMERKRLKSLSLQKFRN